MLSALVEVAKAHAQAEADGDLDAILATLEDNPVYEMYPVGLTFSGMTMTRRYYEHFVATAQKQIAGFELHSEWSATQGLRRNTRCC